MRDTIERYFLGLIFISVMGLTGCAGLKEPAGNYPYIDPHGMDNTNIPRRPTSHSAYLDSTEYQELFRQWDKLVRRDHE